MSDLKTTPKPALKKSSLALNGADIANLLAPIYNAFAGRKDGVVLYLHILHDGKTTLIELDLRRENSIMITHKAKHTAPINMELVKFLPTTDKVKKNPAIEEETFSPPLQLAKYLQDILMPQLCKNLTNVTSVSYYIRAK